MQSMYKCPSPALVGRLSQPGSSQYHFPMNTDQELRALTLEGQSDFFLEPSDQVEEVFFTTWFTRDSWLGTAAALSRLPGENHATPGEKEVNPHKERSQKTESGSPECHPSGLTTSHQLLGYLVMEANKFLLNLSHLKLGFCQWQPES